MLKEKRKHFPISFTLRKMIYIVVLIVRLSIQLNFEKVIERRIRDETNIFKKIDLFSCPNFLKIFVYSV